jgi:hypothetical protein
MFARLYKEIPFAHIGPLLDRIDIHIEVPSVKFKDLNSEQTGASSADMAAAVSRARSLQSARFSGIDGIWANSHMSSRHIRRFCKIDSDGQSLLKNAITRLGFSARAYDRILKLARTIAIWRTRKRYVFTTSPKPFNTERLTGSIGDNRYSCVLSTCFLIFLKAPLPF